MTDNKMVMTKQRRCILAELRKVISHPTADELYMMVRDKLPRISLGTVYRNLEIMADAGIILKLEHAGQKRFDGNPHPHYHFRCSTCGKVYDLPIAPFPEIENMLGNVEGHQIDGYILEFSGNCKCCEN